MPNMVMTVLTIIHLVITKNGKKTESQVRFSNNRVCASRRHTHFLDFYEFESIFECDIRVLFGYIGVLFWVNWMSILVPICA